MSKKRGGRRSSLPYQKQRKSEQSSKKAVIGLVVLAMMFVAAIMLAYRSDLPPQIDHQVAPATLPQATERLSSMPSTVDAPEPSASADTKRTPDSPIGSNGYTGIRFAACGSVRINCVVDGDAFWLNREKIRIADIGAPEIGQPKCSSEYQLGMDAKHRLMELLNDGPFDLQRYDQRDKDIYGRSLRVVVRDGVSIGELLVEEGLAARWQGRRAS